MEILELFSSQNDDFYFYKLLSSSKLRIKSISQLNYEKHC